MKTVGEAFAHAIEADASSRAEAFTGPWPRFRDDGSVEWLYPPDALPGPGHVPGVVTTDYYGGGAGSVSVDRPPRKGE